MERNGNGNCNGMHVWMYVCKKTYKTNGKSSENFQQPGIFKVSSRVVDCLPLMNCHLVSMITGSELMK